MGGPPVGQGHRIPPPPTAGAPAGNPRAFPGQVHTGYGGGSWRAADHAGEFHLFVIDGEQVQKVDTTHGVRDLVRAKHIIIWNEGGVASRIDDAVVFGAVLTQQLSGKDYRWGVIGQGAAQPGRNAPWVILDPPEELTAWLREEWPNLWDANGAPVAPLLDDEAVIAGRVARGEEPF